MKCPTTPFILVLWFTLLILSSTLTLQKIQYVHKGFGFASWKLKVPLRTREFPLTTTSALHAGKYMQIPKGEVNKKLFNKVRAWWEYLLGRWRRNWWWKFKNWLCGYTVYVLECENGKYYVGSTTREKSQRFKEHTSNRGGSVWTRLHKPQGVVEEFKRVPAAYYLGLEATITANYMLKYGINNVRGAMFSERREYTHDDIPILTPFLGHHCSLDYKELTKRLESDLNLPDKDNMPYKMLLNKPLSVTKSVDMCYNCGELGHWAADCSNQPIHGAKKSDKSSMSAFTSKADKFTGKRNRKKSSGWVGSGSAKSDDKCYLCGELGHWASNCPSKKGPE